MADKTVVLIPNPPRYKLRYQKQDGVIKTYSVVPIERKADGLTAYAFADDNVSGGIRTFKFTNILDID